MQDLDALRGLDRAPSSSDATRPAPGRVTLTSRLAPPREAPTAPPAAPASVQRKEATAPALDPFAVHLLAAEGVAGASQRLPYHDELVASFGRHGAALDGARAQIGGPAAEASAAIGARAYATGDRVAFASAPDRALAAHEAAHVVQQKASVSLSGGVGAAGDPYEQHADQVGAAFARGDRAEPILDRMPGGGGAGLQRAVQRDADERGIDREHENLDQHVSVELVAHASPVWEHRGGRGRAELNLHLSQDRLAAVQPLLNAMLRSGLGAGRAGAVQCTFESHAVDDQVPAAGKAVGDQVTLGESQPPGDEKADDRAMRRVDIVVTIDRHIDGERDVDGMEDVEHPAHCDPDATDLWALKLVLSGGAGHLGVGGVFAEGRLKNRITGQEMTGMFVGAGPGEGLSTPGADPGWGDYTNFRTDRPVTFEAFDGTPARFTVLEAGILIIGYSQIYMHFDALGGDSIDLGGWNMGQLGADASTNFGAWKLVGHPPGPICHARYVDKMPTTDQVPYHSDAQDKLRHAVHFDRGSAVIGGEELADLQRFVNRVGAAYH